MGKGNYRRNVIFLIAAVTVFTMVLPISTRAESRPTHTEPNFTYQIKQDGADILLSVSCQTEETISALQFTVSYEKASLTLQVKPQLNKPWAASLAHSTVPQKGEATVALLSAGGIRDTKAPVATLRFRAAEQASSSLYLKNTECILSDGTTYTHAFTAPATLHLGEAVTLEPGTTFPLHTAEDRMADTVVFQLQNPIAARSGKFVQIDAENKAVYPFTTAEGRTLVPLRFLAEAMGLQVTWVEKTQEIQLKKDGLALAMQIKSTEYTYNGTAYQMESPPILWQDRTLVPLRVVAERFGVGVTWQEQDALIILTPSNRPWMDEGSAEQEMLGRLALLLPKKQEKNQILIDEAGETP